LHEIKHDGHRQVAILDGRGGLRLISRNGFARTGRFRAPLEEILSRIRHELVIDGEVAIPEPHPGYKRLLAASPDGWNRCSIRIIPARLMALTSRYNPLLSMLVMLAIRESPGYA
jgi:hypothetical protein